MNESWPHALNQRPPLAERRATIERLGEVVREILAHTGMTEDELVDEITRDWPSSGDDISTQAKRTDSSLRSE